MGLFQHSNCSLLFYALSLCCSAADPEFYFKRLLKEQEKGLTARPLKLTVHLNQAGAKTRWLKNGNPMTVYNYFSICVPMTIDIFL
jgi:hypothetical protein